MQQNVAHSQRIRTVWVGICAKKVLKDIASVSIRLNFLNKEVGPGF